MAPVAVPLAGAALVVSAVAAVAFTDNASDMSMTASGLVPESPSQVALVTRDYVRTDQGLTDEPRIERPEAETSGVLYVLDPGPLRVSPSSTAHKVEDLRLGTEVPVTGTEINGYAQVLIDGQERWIRADRLGDERPFGTTPCPLGSGVEAGLQPDAVRVYRAVCQAFPEVRRYGGVGGGGDHAAGRAVDIMVNGPLGDEIVQFLIDHQQELGVRYLIWEQRYWSVDSPQWSMMADRGSATQNHYDHVHVSTFVDSGGQ